MALTKLRLSQLLDTYSKLLTDKQREALSMYCDCDCSLGEIAEDKGISRQGVRDAIVKGEAALVKYEEALGLCDFRGKLYAAMQDNDNEAIAEILQKFVNKE